MKFIYGQKEKRTSQIIETDTFSQAVIIGKQIYKKKSLYGIYYLWNEVKTIKLVKYYKNGEWALIYYQTQIMAQGKKLLKEEKESNIFIDTD